MCICTERNMGHGPKVDMLLNNNNNYKKLSIGAVESKLKFIFIGNYTRNCPLGLPTPLGVAGAAGRTCIQLQLQVSITVGS